MTCFDTCVKPTPAQAHCSVCHVTFGSVRAFDRHRKVDRRTMDAECLRPGAMGLRNVGGVWRYPGDTRFVGRLRPQTTEEPSGVGLYTPGPENADLAIGGREDG